MRIIDFRLRPPFGSYLNTIMYANIERTAVSAKKKGMDVARSARERSIDLLIQEMDQAQVTLGVAPGRTGGVFGTMSNDDLTQLIKNYPGRFAGFAGIDPVNRKRAIQEIDRAMQIGLKGVVLEPGLSHAPMHIDDARVYPLYAHCEDRGIPVLLMAGGNAGPDCSYSSPEHIDRVARDFPDLVLISGHGNWPWVGEIIHVCYRRPNVHLSPDTYMFGMPGARDYVDAVNGFLSNRFLFGTAYPFVSLKSAVDRFLQLGIKEEFLDDVLYANAARILRLNA
ncbi:MAG: amidohydrolase [Betaproteobacteria bacterium]|nr:amidohydrolase [Betaproteobacteria bacterium]